ncbi:hypothetical protein ALFP_1782 [Alcaligenes faecalis]|uniref:hypothetical protein n=1 Tax=Alcaligenes faecalis TaxID=511 RepID=UPI0007C50651|nr:hypothetical protein [Alcaligenes faecalis]ARP53669.1 hypothetical protein ALFP_1782 [Alcaligenes faecalis]
MKKITNLTNSPYDLQGVGGRVRLPAFGSVDGEFSGEYLDLLAASMAVRVEDAAGPELLKPDSLSEHESSLPETSESEAIEHEPSESESSNPPAADQPAADSAEPTDAHAQYEAMTGKPADKRWSEKRLAEEIAKLQKD